MRGKRWWRIGIKQDGADCAEVFPAYQPFCLASRRLAGISPTRSCIMEYGEHVFIIWGEVETCEGSRDERERYLSELWWRRRGRRGDETTHSRCIINQEASWLYIVIL